MTNEHKIAIQTLRYAIAWCAADSWDGCSECRQRLELAQSMANLAFGELSNNDLAAIGERVGATLAMADPEGSRDYEALKTGSY